jgi:hypothetical protein
VRARKEIVTGRKSALTVSRVRRALERRDRALDAADSAYLALAWEVRERLPAPEDLLADS